MPSEPSRRNGDDELDRRLAPGLDDRTRLLAVAIAAIGPADWPLFAAAAGRLRRDAAPRAELEETLLQATLFFGFPRVVTAFEQLGQAWPAATGPEPGEGVPPDQRAARGRELFAAIYAANDEPVRAMLRAFHPEFHDFVLEAAYGRVLARPGLSLQTRELLAVTALTALDQRPQLVAHGRGALRCGARRDEVLAAIRAAGVDDREARLLLRRI